MSIISISRGSYSRGVEVAEKVATRLGYRCLARDAVLAASETYDVEEIKLVKAIESPPSIFDRLSGGTARYVAFIRATLLKHFLDDDVVYHGLVGHCFLQGVSHALKVRILADLDDRVAIVMRRDNITEQEARQFLATSDKARRQWGLQVDGIDPEDPSLYDAVIHVGKMGTEGAVDLICGLVEQQAFQTTPESQAGLQDMALAAAIEAAIVDMQQQHEAEVSASDGEVLVRLRRVRGVHAGSYSGFRARYIGDLQRRLREHAINLPGMKSLEVVMDD